MTPKHNDNNDKARTITGTALQPLMKVLFLLGSGLSLMMGDVKASTATNAPASADAAKTMIQAAPSFAGGADAGKSITLASLRGKPVILLLAPSPRDKNFRAQMSELRGSYERLAAQGMVAFAGFTEEGGRIPSNIPFVLLNDPAGTASSYDIQRFAIAIIGRDGNLDCLSTKPLPGQRILDLVMNNAEMQRSLRR